MTPAVTKEASGEKNSSAPFAPGSPSHETMPDRSPSKLKVAVRLARSPSWLRETTTSCTLSSPVKANCAAPSSSSVSSPGRIAARSMAPRISAPSA